MDCFVAFAPRNDGGFADLPGEQQQQKAPAALATGASVPNVLRMKSVGADVDGAEHDAVRGEHPAGLVAAVIAATDVADAKAEAMTPVVVMPSTTPPAAPRLGGSGGGSQRHGAEGSGGNESESNFAKHGLSPLSDARSTLCLGAG